VLAWTSCGSHDDLDKWRRVHCGAPTAAPLTVNLKGFLPFELLVRVLDKGLGKTEEKLSGWKKLSTTKDPRARK
jgi:hypothetical protein